MKITQRHNLWRGALLLALVGCKGNTPPHPSKPAPLAPVAAEALRAVKDFAHIDNVDMRSAALFLEASRVMLHPRCSNCHPSGDAPLQGDASFLHEPPVLRGPDNRGVVGMECNSCHQSKNLELGRVPGAANWHLASRKMAWVGKTPQQLCEQLKDPKRNGDKTLEEIAVHTETDGFIAWAWEPGHGRSKPPGSQDELGKLIRAWVSAGASCPETGAKP